MPGDIFWEGYFDNHHNLVIREVTCVKRNGGWYYWEDHITGQAWHTNGNNYERNPLRAVVSALAWRCREVWRWAFHELHPELPRLSESDFQPGFLDDVKVAINELQRMIRDNETRWIHPQ